MTAGPAPTTPGPTARHTGDPTGTWRAVARGWRVLVPAILGNAAVQALLVIGDPVSAPDPAFAARVAASAVALVLTIAVVTVGALAAVDGRPPAGGRGRRRLAPVAGWTAVLGILAGAASVLAVWLGPVVLLGGLLLPAVAAGPGNPLPPTLRAVRAHPGRAVTILLGFGLLAAVSWVFALLLGLLVTGPIAAAATWVWFGAAATVLLCAGAALLRRGPNRSA